MQKKLWNEEKHNFRTFEKEIDGKVLVGYDAVAAINRNDPKYEERIAELKAFNQLNGHCNVPQGYNMQKIKPLLIG